MKKEINLVHIDKDVISLQEMMCIFNSILPRYDVVKIEEVERPVDNNTWVISACYYTYNSNGEKDNVREDIFYGDSIKSVIDKLLLFTK
jgi:hypothetical protein